MASLKPATIIATLAAAAGIVVGATGVWLLPDAETHSDSIAVQEKSARSDSRPWVAPVALMPTEVPDGGPDGDAHYDAAHFGSTCRAHLEVADTAAVLSDEEVARNMNGEPVRAEQLGRLVPVITWVDGGAPLCAYLEYFALWTTKVQIVRDPQIVTEAIRQEVARVSGSER